MSDGTQLVRYDAMCSAIAAAYQVDEVKDIRDKALAIERYARQAKNTEAERQACEIRLRAERRCGRLLREREMAKGAREPGTNRGTTRSDDTTASKLADLRISKQQSSDWQQLADVPDDDFELALSEPRPTTNGILAAYEQLKHPVDMIGKDALWVHGRLKDFERNDILEADPTRIMDSMLPHMRDDMRRLVPLVISWLEATL